MVFVKMTFNLSIIKYVTMHYKRIVITPMTCLLRLAPLNVLQYNSPSFRPKFVSLCGVFSLEMASDPIYEGDAILLYCSEAKGFVFAQPPR